MTINPETQVTASWYDPQTDTFTYVLDTGARATIPAAAFARVTPGRLGVPERRAILAKALQEAACT